MVILPDTSAWVDFTRGIDEPWTRAIGRAPIGSIVVGDLILVEVLQGIRDDRELKTVRSILVGSKQVALCGPVIAEKAASNYRLLRRNGITIRGTIDVIIATWCISNGASIIHNDRDLGTMERHLGLVAYAG